MKCLSATVIYVLVVITVITTPILGYGIDGVRDSTTFENDLGWDEVNEGFFNVSFEGDVWFGAPTDNIGQLMAFQELSTFTQVGDIMNWTQPAIPSGGYIFDGLVEDHYVTPLPAQELLSHTIEYRVRLNSWNRGGESYALRLAHFDGFTRELYVYLAWEDTSMQVYTANGRQTVTLPQGFDFTAWHNYRFAVLGADPSDGNKVKANLYVDSNLLYEEFPVYVEPSSDVSQYNMISNAEVDVDVDYVRLDNTGAYAPGGQVVNKVTLQGVVALQAYTGDRSKVGATIELRQGGYPVRTETLWLGTNGAFALTNVDEGTYDVVVKVAGWLGQIVAAVDATTNPSDMGVITLPGGDLNGDGIVNLTDEGVVAGNWLMTIDP